MYSKQSSWIRGLNTLVSNTQIKDVELSQADDIQLVEDGKIQFPRDGQAYFGSESGSKVTGLFPYYKSDGTNQLLRMSGTALQKYNSGSWSDVSGYTYTTTLDAYGVMAYDKLYICNGTDELTVYDGSSLTSFTEISAPSAPTVTRTGTTGSYTFSYKITAVTAVGETTPSTAGTSNLNQATLDSSNYMSLSWSAVTSAIGYNVYGRKDGKWYFIAYVEGNSSTSYVDKGTVTPQEAFTPPEGNTTGGPKGKYIGLYKDSLFIFGDPSNPSRLYYSAGGDLVSDFTVGSGGGFIDISKNDGQQGTGVIRFKDALLVFKENSIYKFGFSTSGLPQVEQVSGSIGAASQRSIVAVENDVFFYAKGRGVFTIGNEAGFSFDVLRTNELSAKVRSYIQSISGTRHENVSAVYATTNNVNLIIFSYTPSGSTTNSEALVYDRERLAWYRWTNIQANCWANYRDSSGVESVLYGDDASGYVKQILTGSDDFGTAITATARLKAVDFKEPARYKRLKNLDIILRQPTGNITLNIIKDGVTTEVSIPLTSINPTVNFGHYVFTEFLFGESIGTGVTAQDENLLKTKKNVNIEGRSFLLEFKNSSNAHFTLLFAGMTGKLRGVNYRKGADLIT